MDNPRSNVGPDSVPLKFMNKSSTIVLIPAQSYGKRDMTFNNYVPCGGPNFDPLLDDWSRFVVVADDGDIIDRGNALNCMETGSLSVNEAIQLAGKYALNAAKIYVYWIDPETGAASEPCLLSGTWIEGKFFITVAHFFGGKGYSDKQEAAIITGMLKPDHQPVSWVSTRIHNEKYSMQHDDQVTLCAFDRDSDLAIFRSKSDSSPTPRKTLKFSDLSTLPTTSTHPKSEVIWTVGYAGKDPALPRPAKIAMVFDYARGCTAEEKKEILNDDSINTKFGFYLDLYKRKMRKMYEAGDTVGKNIYTKIMSSPESIIFANIFQANLRALALGHLPKVGDNGYKAPQAKGKYTVYRTHTISAFHGLSGSMVVRWAPDEKSLQVIGLLSALEAEISANYFWGFSQDGLKWIEGFVCPKSSSQ